MSVLLDDVRCRACRSFGIFVEVYEERSEVVVEARCHSCDHDFGVIGGAPRALDVTGDVMDAGEALAREVLG